MKRFNALKKVNAKPMARQEYNDLRGWDLPADENGADDGYLTVDINSEPNLNGYDGYVSWTPKAMFENQFYEADDQRVGVGCAAPQDPDHEANKVTKEQLDDLVAKSNVEYAVFGNKLTVAVITLQSNFKVTGEASCVDPANFDKAFGEKYALENAVEKLWELEGYLLANDLHRAKGA